MRKRPSGGFLSLAAFVILASSAAPLSALTVNPSSSVLAAASGCGTASNFCFSKIFLLSGTESVSGSFDIVGTTLNFSVDLVTATLTGSDGAVSAVVFSDVNYSGSFSVVDEGSNFFSFADQEASMSGTLTAIGPGSAVPFDFSPDNLILPNPVFVTGTCEGTPGSSLTCGLNFGVGGGFEIDVNENPRYFKHTVNLFSVPEPGTALLLGLGLSGLAVNRRRSARVAN